MCRKRRRWALIWCEKTFICDNQLKSYAHLNALNTENVNARNPGSKFSFTIIEIITCFKILPLNGVFKYIFHV